MKAADSGQRLLEFLTEEQQVRAAGAVIELYPASSVSAQTGDEGCERADASAAGEHDDLRVSFDNKITIRQLDPNLAADAEFRFHACGKCTLDRVADYQVIPLCRTTGNREDAGLGPESRRVVLIQSKMEELAGAERGQGRFGLQDDGVHAATVVSHSSNGAANLARRRHAKCRESWLGLSLAQKIIERGGHVLQMRIGQTRINANEEGISRDQIGVFQSADDPVSNIFEGGMEQEVAAEQTAGFDFEVLEMRSQFGSREACV